MRAVVEGGRLVKKPDLCVVKTREKVSSQEAKQRLVNIITEKQGMKAVELAGLAALSFSCDESVVLLLDELVREKSIVEVEYVLPNMSYRIKSMFFPKGTVFPE